MPILGKQLAHQFSTDKAAKTIMQRLGIAKTGGSSSNQDLPTSAKGKKTDLQVSPGQTTMIASSMMDSTNPNFTIDNPQRAKAHRKKKKDDEHQKSSFLSSEGALLEELLDPAHPFHAKFVDFVKSRYAENEMEMLSQCLKFKYARDSKERSKIGKHIMREFVDSGAPKEVDIPADLKDSLIITARQAQWSPTTFDVIRRNLAFDLKGNFLGAFEKRIDMENEKQAVPPKF